MCSVVPSELQKHQHRLVLRALDLDVDRAAVRLDGGHCLSPNDAVMLIAALLSSGGRASQMHHDMHGLPISTASTEAAAAFDRTLTGYLKYRADAGSGWRERLRPTASSRLAHCLKGYFAHALLQAGERAAAARGRAAGAAAEPRTRRRASRRMSRRSRPGSPAISIARSASGSRSWPSIRATCWRFAWRISTISGSGGRPRCAPRSSA